VLLWVIGAACAVSAAVMAKFHRLAAITLMGGAGLVTCVTFAWFSAPDLALTQIVVEVVTTTLFLLGLRWLPMRISQDVPRVTPRDRGGRGSRDAVVRPPDSARTAQHLDVLPQPCVAGRRRKERRQRHARRLPRVRHDG
jgi:uncharacterized MnhB-related membrane protein